MGVRTVEGVGFTEFCWKPGPIDFTWKLDLSLRGGRGVMGTPDCKVKRSYLVPEDRKLVL